LESIQCRPSSRDSRRSGGSHRRRRRRRQRVRPHRTPCAPNRKRGLERHARGRERGGAAGGSGDIDGDGLADFSFTPAGAEKVAELYYRYRVAPQLDITPDFQLITRGGANPDAGSVKVVGLRANIAY
jgi:hypothetical protein